MQTNSLASRHPHEVFLLIACLTTTLPIVAGVTPTPGSIASLMSPLVAHLWASGILLGALTALVGIAWPRPDCPLKLTVTGLLLEQVGLLIAGLACGFYVLAAFFFIGWGALFPSAMPAGFTLANVVLAYRIQALLVPNGRAVRLVRALCGRLSLRPRRY